MIGRKKKQKLLKDLMRLNLNGPFSYFVWCGGCNKQIYTHRTSEVVDFLITHPWPAPTVNRSETHPHSAVGILSIPKDNPWR